MLGNGEHPGLKPSNLFVFCHAFAGGNPTPRKIFLCAASPAERRSAPLLGQLCFFAALRGLVAGLSAAGGASPPCEASYAFSISTMATVASR